MNEILLYSLIFGSAIVIGFVGIMVASLFTRQRRTVTR